MEKSNITDKIKLPGQLEAYQEVSIFPKVNGYVKTVLVDIGSSVHKGQLLMELEAPELIQATLSAKEKYAKSRADYAIDRSAIKGCWKHREQQEPFPAGPLRNEIKNGSRQCTE